MKQFLITVGGVLVGLILFVFILPVLIISTLSASLGSAAPVTPSNAVIALDLREEMRDQRSSSPFAGLEGPALMDVLARIDAARTDDHVKGLYIRAASGGMAAAQAEEIRAALAAFRQSGKFVVAHIQNDGVRMSMPGYLAIADADEIWLQETGEMPPMGLTAEFTFLADTLQRYHMQAQFEAREEYKTFANTFTQDRLTPAHRESAQSLMNGIYDQLIAGIAADRGVSVEEARAAVEATPLTAARAQELRLVDQLGRPEDAERAALARAGDNAQAIDFLDYHPSVRGGGDVIAVVQAEGPITTGVREDALFSDDAVIYSDEIAGALLDASDDADVDAIVFRVSSPGGSAVASDQILHALRTARERGKPVVVSMGEVAASGGYYVSADADAIVASPTTITGSIGIVGGKLIVGPAFEHYLSTNTETLSLGSPLVNMFSAETPFSQSERAAFAAMIDRGYEEFLGVVAQGREMSVDDVRAIAGGRVWTGQQALDHGLVDELGGFQVALARARTLAGIEEDARVQLRTYPLVRNPFEALERMFGVSAEGAEALARLNAVMSDPRVARALAAADGGNAGLRAETGELQVR